MVKSERLNHIILGLKVSLIIKLSMIKNFKNMLTFMENYDKQEKDVIARVNVSRLAEIGERYTLETAIRRELVIQKGCNMPFEIHFYSDRDLEGEYGLKYILTDISDIENPSKITAGVRMNGIDGKCYTYIALEYDGYEKYLKKQKKHPLKDTSNSNTCKIIDLEFIG